MAECTVTEHQLRLPEKHLHTPWFPIFRISTILDSMIKKNLRFRILQHTVLARVERTRKEAGTLTDTTRNGG
jgi:hypothetical protein